VAKLEEANEKSCGIDLIYDDLTGIKVAVAVIINNDRTKTFDQISDRMKSTISADRFIILTNINAYNTTDKASVVNIDRRKMIDLIYFSSKYKNNEIMLDDSQRALMLAKSIKLC
jgi:alpha-D-ribose 1-methylphosphonate 5-phosphate C-P lyase